MNENLTAIFEREGIRKVERYRALDQFSVVLVDGSLGTGRTVADALAAAKAPNAENVLAA